MRGHFDNNIWLYNIERRMMLIDRPVVLIDCRFKIEIEMARLHNSKIVLIKRDPQIKLDGYRSPSKCW